jgi:hypothetical protein
MAPSSEDSDAEPIHEEEEDKGALAARLQRNANNGSVEHWERLATATLKQGYWNRLGNLTKSLDSLPLDIEEMFNEMEERNTVRLNAESRLMYYVEFTRTALGATTLHFRDVEALIVRKNPEIMINRIDFLTLLTSKFHELSKETNEQSENTEYVDFKHFAALLYDLFKHYEDRKRATEGRWSFEDFKRQFPLDPDSKQKQLWDTLSMLLLLYCSFSVPYSIAFDSDDPDQKNNAKESFEQVIDVVFMVDIFLNFITAWDNQGFIVREFSWIAKNYLRSWFLPDFAGSFPFDTTIAAFVDTDAKTLKSTTFIRGLKLIRMLKLIRAIKFMNKLEKLKQNEGFEAFGAAITLLSAAFFLFFTAHLLGCFYTILLSYEDGDNWLLNYSPDLASADVSTRYIVSIYWAMITIRSSAAPHISQSILGHAEGSAVPCSCPFDHHLGSLHPSILIVIIDIVITIAVAIAVAIVIIMNVTIIIITASTAAATTTHHHHRQQCARAAPWATGTSCP